MRKLLTKFLNMLTGICFMVMVVLTFGQVLMRYLFNNPLTWSEEFVSYLFAWSSLLGACLVTSERGHMNIPLLGHKLSARGQKILGIIGEGIGLAFSLTILCYGGLQITFLAMGQQTSSLGVSVGVFYVLLPVAGVLNALYAALNIRDIWTGRMPAFPAD